MLTALKNKLVQNGTHGGPDFDHSEHHQIDCGFAHIDILQPGSLIDNADPKRYPRFVDLSDFDANAVESGQQRRTGHRHVTVEAALWQYRQPRWFKHQHDPFTLVTAIWTVEKLKAPLAGADTSALSHYLQSDYQQYFEAQGGHNWQLRQKALAFCATRQYQSEPARVDAYYQSILDGSADPGHLAQVEEEYGDYIDSCVEADRVHLPQQFEQVQFAGEEWVRFSWSHHGVRPDNLYYCRPLGNQYQLVVDFSLNRMLPDCDQYWLDRAKEDFEKVITGTRVKTLALPR
ncbi:hypothetical protein [Gallaecimonas xiamenensis]|uniref:Uncharacterized protein n=1 Tax=Gallaecimonas xiamenensis 3-C-1 TaxID=745411 RepID=K2IK97_9GAMM|nr:hypothetical protein [Gallaecimonas xiamenensis]EKE70566.1 hypothetical protein B3C1_13548 [Gallaecimonas xiamenensis 3-C-1]